MKRNIYLLNTKTLLFALVWVWFAPLASAQFTVSGHLETPNGLQETGFAIMVTGTENKVVYTDTEGDYSFTLQAGGSYVLQPLSCEENPLNGVTTYDLVLINKHILGTEYLNSPYTIIAADVDNSNQVDTLDIVATRDLIQGFIPNFPVSHFRFVLKSHVFQNPLNPFSPAFPESFSIANLQANITGVDFIGVKKGDVNYTAVDYNECSGSANLPATISGKVYRDLNANCQPDSIEDGMQGWKIQAIDAAGQVYHGVSYVNGQYAINVLPGIYDVVLSNPAGLWSACPDTIHGLNVQIQQGALGNDFGLQPQAYCPAMQVDLSVAILRRCFNNQYKVDYCNNGTIVAENARIEVHFDTLFEVQSSTLPWSNVNGNTYTFELGNVAAGECGSFWVTFKVSCDAVLGQTHCTEAQIFPDTFCAAPGIWNGAALHVQGFCAGDEVQFIISNLGTDMLEPSNYIVVEDIVVMTPPINNPFTLQGSTSEIITVPANGATWRLEAEQAAGYPWGRVASATVEGCGTNANGDFSLGFVNQYPLDDQSPIIDIDCRENSGSYDPNDKQGFPNGVLAEHFIPLEQPIEYLIRFQNTGTDTAFTVMVLDTLDADLDVSTFRPLGSSHPYTFNLLGQNVAQFVFSNILLPDSNVNEAASHGYLKCSIAPKKGALNGTLIENQAAIFFDFNEPVITNKTWHTLGEKYLNLSNIVFSPGVGLEVFPNPTSATAQFFLKSASLIRGTLVLYDLSGRTVANQDFDRNQFEFDATALQAGCYFFKIIAGHHALATGKLIVLRN